MKDTTEKLELLLKYLSTRKQSYVELSNYEMALGSTKSADVVFARKEELDFVMNEIQRIINQNYL